MSECRLSVRVRRDSDGGRDCAHKQRGLEFFLPNI